MTGEGCIASLVWARSVEHLQQITQRLASAGHTIPAVVFSTWFDNPAPPHTTVTPARGRGFGTDR